MKAKYLIAAIDAMREANDITYSMTPEKLGTILAKLQMARIDLQVHSGLSDVELSVEKEPQA